MALVKCPECGAEISDLATSCPKCGAPLKAQNQSINNNPTVNEDKPDVGMNVLSFIFPIVGFILYLVWKNDTPLKAKACGKWAIWGVVAEFVLWAFYSITIASTLSALL